MQHAVRNNAVVHPNSSGYKQKNGEALDKNEDSAIANALPRERYLKEDCVQQRIEKLRKVTYTSNAPL